MEIKETYSVHPMDEMLPFGKLFTYGFQHVLAMYAGAVAVPLVLGAAIHLSVEQIVHLINADLFTCGIATLIQTLGFKNVGARIPMIQGVTFTAVPPMILIGQDVGLTGIYGAIIVSGIVTYLLAGVMGKLMKFFPPVVTGTIIMTIGVTLMPVALNWAGGGVPSAPDFASPVNLALAGFTLLIVLLIFRFGKGFISNISILLGLILGTVVATIFGLTNFDVVQESSWVTFITPFTFGYPEFYISPIISMIIVMIVTMVETTGNCVAIGQVVDKEIDGDTIAKCLRADGLSTVLGGIFNSFPYTAFAQNVGLVAVTGVKSRYVVATSGIILMVLGLFPKLAAFIACIPNPVLGGAGIAMFGIIIAAGIQGLTCVDFSNPSNLMIIAISSGFGIMGIVAPGLFKHAPMWLTIIFQSGITAASISAVVLNLLFNGIPKDEA